VRLRVHGGDRGDVTGAAQIFRKRALDRGVDLEWREKSAGVEQRLLDEGLGRPRQHGVTPRLS
jgi:hypothetical protein